MALVRAKAGFDSPTERIALFRIFWTIGRNKTTSSAQPIPPSKPLHQTWTKILDTRENEHDSLNRYNIHTCSRTPYPAPLRTSPASSVSPSHSPAASDPPSSQDGLAIAAGAAQGYPARPSSCRIRHSSASGSGTTPGSQHAAAVRGRACAGAPSAVTALAT